MGWRAHYFGMLILIELKRKKRRFYQITITTITSATTITTGLNTLHLRHNYTHRYAKRYSVHR